MPRKRQPVDLLIAKGKKHLTKAEIGKRRNQEVNAPVGEILIPEYLPKELGAEFVWYAERLKNINIMTELDTDALARYLLAKTIYNKLTQKALSVTKKSPLDLVVLEKVILLQDKAFKQCHAAAGVLGLTISSRCKLVIPKEEEKKPVNKFLKFDVANSDTG